MFLVDDDQPDARQRREQRRARADDHRQLAGADATPYCEAFGRLEPRVNQRHLAGEAFQKTSSQRRRQVDFGDEDDGTGPTLEGGSDSTHVYLGLARSVRAAQHKSTVGPSADGIPGALLIYSKNRRSANNVIRLRERITPARGAAEVDPFLFGQPGKIFTSRTRLDEQPVGPCDAGRTLQRVQEAGTTCAHFRPHTRKCLSRCKFFERQLERDIGDGQLHERALAGRLASGCECGCAHDAAGVDQPLQLEAPRRDTAQSAGECPAQQRPMFAQHSDDASGNRAGRRQAARKRVCKRIFIRRRRRQAGRDHKSTRSAQRRDALDSKLPSHCELMRIEGRHLVDAAVQLTQLRLSRSSAQRRDDASNERALQRDDHGVAGPHAGAQVLRHEIGELERHRTMKQRNVDSLENVNGLGVRHGRHCLIGCIRSLGRISTESAERAAHAEFRAETPRSGDAGFLRNRL